MRMRGTGPHQPARHQDLLPAEAVGKPPAKRLENALTSPKVTMNEKMAVLRRPELLGADERHYRALQTHHPAHEGVHQNQQRELSQVLLQTELDGRDTEVNLQRAPNPSPQRSGSRRPPARWNRLPVILPLQFACARSSKAWARRGRDLLHEEVLVLLQVPELLCTSDSSA